MFVRSRYAPVEIPASLDGFGLEITDTTRTLTLLSSHDNIKIGTPQATLPRVKGRFSPKNLPLKKVPTPFGS
jgi:hypothetical protein